VSHLQIGEPAQMRNSRTNSAHGVGHAINEARHAADDVMPDCCAESNAEGQGM
jgi:hypothetical protein